MGSEMCIRDSNKTSVHFNSTMHKNKRSDTLKVAYYSFVRVQEVYTINVQI